MKPQYIRYGLGLDYVPKWGIQQALREIFQNYIDFGQYKIDSIEDVDFEDRTDPLMIQLTITNDWNPEDFRFLIIGNSNKNADQIGKYGEGLKLALLVCLRLGYTINLRFGNYLVVPFVSKNEMLGCDTLAVKILYISEKAEGFTTIINLPKEEFYDFAPKILDKTRVLFSCDYGDVIDYTAGQIFVGGIWVCNVNGFSKAYNFRPKHVPLDRDREVPQSFHIELYASYIQGAQQLIKIEDIGLDDNKYIQNIPQEIKKQVVPISTGKGNVEFTNKKTGQVLPERVTKLLLQESEFQEEIQALKESENVSDTEAIANFKNKWLRNNTEAQMDFDLLIKKLNKL